MAQVLSNVSVRVNNASIRKETRNGRECIIVPSKTLPAGIVMNGIMYPDDEIKKSYAGLEGTPAPYGHPKVNGKHVSASNPYAINISWIGAHNENVVYSDGRVSLDKVIDVQVANQTENGRAVLAAIEKQEPIHTSTGIFMQIEETPEPVTNSAGKTYSKIAKNMMFDHDCFLLNEEGAATPSEGVGIFVNAAGEEIEVMNSSISENLEESYDEEITWAAKRLADALQAKDNAKKSNGIIAKIMALFSGDVTPEASGLTANHDKQEGDQMSVTQEKFDALADQVKNLQANVSSITQSVTDAVTAAIAPLQSTITELQTNAKADEAKERSELVTKLIKNNLLAEGEDKDFTVNQLRTIASKIKTETAAPLLAGYTAVNNADLTGFVDPNIAIEKALNAGAQ